MRQQKLSLSFSIFIFIIFCFAAWKSLSFAELARFFPLYISVAGAVLTLVHIIISSINIVRNKQDEKSGKLEELGSVFKYIVWVIGYIILIFVIGFLPATVVFLFAFLLKESKFGIIKTVIGVALTMSIILLFSNLMNLYWPTGIINVQDILFG